MVGTTNNDNRSPGGAPYAPLRERWPVAFDIYVGCRRYTPEELLPRVADAGFEALNIPYRSRFKDDGRPVDATRLQPLLEAAGFSVPSVYLGGPEWSAQPPCSEHRENLAKALELAHTLGAKLLGIWPGRTADEPGVAAQQRTHLTACLQTYLPRILEAGLTPSLEFEPSSVVPSLAEAVMLSDTLDGKLGLCVDTHHLNNLGIPADQALFTIGERLAEIHLSSTVRGPSGGEGDAYNYGQLCAALSRNQYVGPLTAQYPLEDLDTLPLAAAFARFWRDRTWGRR